MQRGNLELERILRGSYGKILSHLMAKGFDVMTAEDSIAAAVETALKSWESTGVPQSPDGWLFTVAYRKAVDARRHARRSEALDLELEAEADFEEVGAVKDERLRLFFLCTHPAIDAEIQTPLMLQLVLGLTAAQISELYLIPESQLAQRLVRAKRKIRDAKILPEYPGEEALPERVGAILLAIYGLYTRGWEQPGNSERLNAAVEAMELAAMVAGALPEDPEASGLFALILFSEARRPARVAQGDVFVALDEQDSSLWNQEKLRVAERVLFEASRVGRPGRFQLEAAIQSAHVSRISRGFPDWGEILRLYDRLVSLAPTKANLIGRSVVVAKVHGAGQAIGELLTLDGVADYQPYHAVLCHLFEEVGDSLQARVHAERAFELSEDPAVRAYFTSRFTRS